MEEWIDWMQRLDESRKEGRENELIRWLVCWYQKKKIWKVYVKIDSIRVTIGEEEGEDKKCEWEWVVEE